MMKLSRSDVFISALNIAFVEYYYRKYNSRRSSISSPTQIKMVMALLVAIALMYVSVVLRIGADAPNVYGSLGFNLNVPSPLYEVLALVYAYFALPFENFHRFLMSYTGDLHLGISFFRPLLSMFGQGEVADSMIATINFNVISGAANTGTFLTPVYAELGMVGLVIVPPMW